jgi:hypothetical protein
VLDDLDLLEQLGAAPVFSANGMGRELKPNELNPLTKACADADANANGVEDYLEHQTMPLEGVDPDLVPFTALAYFVELHHGFFSPVPINQACDANGSCGDVTLACNAATNQCERLGGAWVIEERSRCAPDAFPLQYPPADDYWRACVRNRRMSFDADASQLGHDFARFSCAESTGQCAPQAPVPLDPPATPVTCDDRVTAAAFMGMHHHSQFQCVQFVSADDVVDRAFQRPLTAADGPQPSLNRCRVVCPANDENCVDDCDPVDGCAASALGEAGQPAEPILECAIAAELALGDIGFVATPYTTAANGVAPEGCINEWFPAPETGPHADIVDTWRRRCTGFRVDPQPIFGSGSPAAFGELRCGCGLNNGGTDCEIGCPNLLGARYGGTGDPAECPDNGYCTTPRAGFWLCGSVGGPTDLPPSDDAQAWRLRAPSHPTAMGTLCEGGPCPSPDQPAMGWRLHPGE